MPTYEYQCASCGHQFEAFQKITEAPLTVCPKCNKTAVTKLVSASNFQLKGTGWYATDFKDKGKPKPTETAKEAKTEAETAKTPEKTKEKEAASGSEKPTTKDSTG